MHVTVARDLRHYRMNSWTNPVCVGLWSRLEMVLSPENTASTVRSQSIGIRSTVPLCVDLDGTLIYGDLLWECIVLLLKRNLAYILLIPCWLLQGGVSNLKSQLAQRVQIDADNLPYNLELLEFVRTEREGGRQVILVTGTDHQVAEHIADHTALFDEVNGSHIGNNLKGRRKGEFLLSRFGQRGFEYAGNSSSDLHVWQFASAAYVVGSKAIAEKVSRIVEVRRHFPHRRPSLTLWSRAFRVHHWSKNLLMFVPLLLAHRLHPKPLLMTLVGVVLFGLCSSGGYILNDLLDLPSDRAHPWKDKRPFASGDLSIASGIIAVLALLGISLGLGTIMLNGLFAGALALYLVTTACYSLWLKKIPLIDVFVLSSFYTFRMWAGALITATPLSQWFLGFSLFFFLSLAMAKRYSELVQAGELVEIGNSGRGYRVADREVLMNIGVASSFSAIVILSLYVHSAEVVALYQRPGLLLLLCPLILYWVSRIWLKAHRGELNEDPVTLAISDSISHYVAAAGLGIMLLASIKV